MAFLLLNCRRLGVVVICLLVTLASTPTPALAQNSAPLEAMLVRDQGTLRLESYSHQNLAPHVAVYADPESKLSWVNIRDRFLRGDRPASVSPDHIKQAHRNGTLWLAISIYNLTDQVNWSLDFGERLSGRGTSISSMMILELVGNRTLMNQEFSRAGGPLAPQGLLKISSVLPLTLLPKKPNLFLIRLSPDPSGPTIFPLTLRAGAAPLPDLAWWQNPMTYWILAALTAGGFLLATFITFQTPLVLGAFFALSLPLTALQPAFFLGPASSIGFDLSTFLHGLQALFMIGLLWAFARLAQIALAAPYWALGFVVIQGALMVGVIAIGDATLGPATLVILAPAALWAAIVTVLIMRQEPTAAMMLGSASLAFIISSAVQMLAELSVLPGQLLLLNAQVLASAFICPLLLAGLGQWPLGLDPGDRPKKYARPDKDRERYDQLRLAKESFDYNNLLKVIDHERKQLAAARTREMVRGEEMRKAKEQADEANRAKSAFLAVISHEIRTPMTGIMGMVKLLLDSTMSKTQVEYVQTIKESGNAMMGLLNDILDFEKIETGKMQLENLDFDLHRLLSGVMTLMSGHATNKGIDLRLEQDFSVPHYVVGDMTRLRQVLLNLIGNAIKFTQQGHVIVRVNATSESSDTLANMSYQVYFAIEDSGIGISAEAQKNIFSPFAQADKSIARKFGGTGLGLAISKRLIEAMGSQINIKSRENEGTTFFFTLTMPEGKASQIEDTTSASMSAPSGGTPTKRKLRIMVVEDNNITQRVLQTLIDHQGHTPMIVGSAEEALPYLNMGERFDLILCDIQLTGMSGLEFTRTVRAMNTDFSQTVPILALTGNVEATDVKACLDAGMNGHLAKPIDPDLFEQTLDDMAAQPAGAGPRHSGPSGGIGGGAGRPTIAPALGVETELELLSTLRESLGDAQLNELLRGLYAKTEEIIAALAGQSPIDLEFTRARAHEMKGMCGNFGLSKLAEHSKKIEKQAKDGRTAGLADLIDQLAPLYDRGRDEITAWMQGA